MSARQVVDETLARKVARGSRDLYVGEPEVVGELTYRKVSVGVMGVQVTEREQDLLTAVAPRPAAPLR